MNITEADRRLFTADEVRAFDTSLSRTLEFAERAAMHLSRLRTSDGVGDGDDDLGGWPDGYEFSTESVAACALLADTLKEEAARMTGWAQDLLKGSAYLWFIRGAGSANA